MCVRIGESRLCTISFAFFAPIRFSLTACDWVDNDDDDDAADAFKCVCPIIVHNTIDSDRGVLVVLLVH